MRKMMVGNMLDLDRGSWVDFFVRLDFGFGPTMNIISTMTATTTITMNKIFRRTMAWEEILV